MTRRELVKAAINHQETDRVPHCIDVTAEMGEVVEARTGAPVDEFIDRDVRDFAAPWWGWHELAADWWSPDVPTSPARVLANGSYTDLAENLKAARDTCDRYFLVRLYMGLWEGARACRGMQSFLVDMLAHPDFAREVFRRTLERNLVMLESFLALPEVDGVLLGSDWGTQKGLLMSPELWEEMIRPGEQQQYELIHAHGKDAWVHACGDISAVMPSLVEMGLDVLNPIQPECMDLAWLKRSFGGKLTFWGGISTQDTLPFGTPEEVKAEARRVRKLMATGGGYILAGGQHLQADVPFENLEALLEVARETDHGNGTVCCRG